MLRRVITVAVILLPVLAVLSLGIGIAAGSETEGSLSTGVDTGVEGVVKAAPVATPGTGIYGTAQNVTLAAEGASAIYYTTDSSVPTNASTLYAGPIFVPATTTIRCVAYYGDGLPGPIGNYLYTIGGGGGGGGGGAPGPTIETNLFGTYGSFRTDNLGYLLESITGTSPDGKVTINIPVLTKCLDGSFNPLTYLTCLPVTPPAPPPGANIIGLAYDFGPDDATFDPPYTITWHYDDADIPPGVAEEDLVIAYYDEATGQWVELVCTVDTVNNTVTATIAHYTTFALIAPAGTAVYSFSGLTISPTEVNPGEAVNISLTITNDGGTEGTYTVILYIDNVAEVETTVTLPAGSSQTIGFVVTRDEVGTYAVSVGGLTGSFTVVAAPTTTPPTTTPPTTTPPTTTPPTTTPPTTTPPTTTPPPTGETNWPVVGGIIGAVIVIILLVILFRRRG